MIGTMTTGLTTGAALHARATMLAREAMAAQTTPADPATTSYVLAQQDYHRRLAANREEGIERGRVHNQELKELGEIRRYGGFQRDLPF